mgnify:CR=1 FL=1|tara:strand:+ start:448 stop:1050 length:603 start_codon:yes stop_codon:yes gene_type:complete
MLEHLTLANVDSFLAVILSVGGLYKAGSGFRRNEFEDVIDPLFQATSRVADDYIEMFGATLEAVEGTRDSKSLEEAMMQLRRNRTKMITTRARVGEIVKEIKEITRDGKMAIFLAKIETIFASEGMTQDDRRPQSRSGEMVTRLEMAVAGKVPRSEIISTLRRTLSEIEEAYAALAQSYARLRVKESRRRAGAGLTVGLS